MGTSHCEALDQIMKCTKELTEYARVIYSMALRMALPEPGWIATWFLFGYSVRKFWSNEN